MQNLSRSKTNATDLAIRAKVKPNPQNQAQTWPSV